MSTYPLLKWPGGKQWIAPYISRIITKKLINTYIEPFFGGGAVFFNLKPEKAIISDINMSLINCLKTIRDYPNEVLEKIRGWSNNKDCYYCIRNFDPKELITHAARFIYLSRTCWGGIYRINKKGKFNVPYGGSNRIICKKSNLLSCAEALKHVEIRCSDFESIIDIAGKGDVVYADPPYTIDGNNGFRRYNQELFSWNDQKRLEASCRRAVSREAYVIVSGLWHESILSLYSNWKPTKLRRTVRINAKKGNTRRISEVILLSDN